MMFDNGRGIPEKGHSYIYKLYSHDNATSFKIRLYDHTPTEVGDIQKSLFSIGCDIIPTSSASRS
jgi:hypothetical protein